MSMDSAERISGRSRIAVLNQLKDEKVTLQLVMIGTNYERLTLIVDLREEGAGPYVAVDCPDRFVEDVPDYQGAGIRIEFLGKDRIQYSFTSRVMKVSDNNLWLEMPEFLVRVQRRQFFRIAPPIGTRISFSRIGKPQEASLVNLSEGGALVILNAPERSLSRLVVDEILRDLRLRCVAENLEANVRIAKAVVLREQLGHGKEKAAYAMKFLEIDPRERRSLQEFIFNCQREVLRKRKE